VVAVALADAEGVEAVSMRKVAAALEVGTASLYGYVDSKDELYDLMIDWVEGEDGPPPPLSGDWRGDLSRLAHRIRGSILRHPWMASITAGRPDFGPNSLAWNEYGLAAMDDLGLTIDEMLIASEVLQAFVRGFALRELAEQRALQRAGLNAEEWGRVLGPYLKSVEKSGRYPRFTRVVQDARVPHAENRQELMFTTGLGRILDSLLPTAVYDVMD
jgi:AcrR family transcriptional regulator